MDGYTITSFEDADPAERETAIQRAWTAERPTRTLLSPAEGLNVVTVGALHDDAIEERLPGRTVDPFSGKDLPNLTSALGLGPKRAVKPDILTSGGREHVIPQAGGDKIRLRPSKPGKTFGVGAAQPDVAGTASAEANTGGTSAAAAQVTHALHRVHDILWGSEDGPLTDIPVQYHPVILKALSAHTCEWPERWEELKNIMGPSDAKRDKERKDNVTRFLGYGIPDYYKAVKCAENRVTILGFGDIDSNNADQVLIPLPDSIENELTRKMITVTLAWFTPINVRHQAYRKLKLETNFNTSNLKWLGVERRSENQPSYYTVGQGTLLNATVHGRKAASLIEDGNLNLQVVARDQAGEKQATARYGLAVTIKTGDNLPIYDEIRNKLQVRAVSTT